MRFIFLVFLLVSCSYHFSKVGSFQLRSVNVPYIVGDKDGLLTQELIYQISCDGLLEYKKTNADYLLKVRIIDIVSNQIGYRKDRKPDGTLRKNLMATESRLTISAEVFLVSALDNEVFYGPRIFTTEADFDYVEQDTVKDLSFINKNGDRETVLAFSLGQMESVGCAQEVARRPLFVKLAKNIVSALNAEYHLD